MITSTQMYEDGFIESGSKNVQYDAGSDKQGVITFETDSEDKNGGRNRHFRYGT